MFYGIEHFKIEDRLIKKGKSFNNITDLLLGAFISTIRKMNIGDELELNINKKDALNAVIKEYKTATQYNGIESFINTYKNHFDKIDTYKTNVKRFGKNHKIVFLIEYNYGSWNYFDKKDNPIHFFLYEEIIKYIKNNCTNLDYIIMMLKDTSYIDNERAILLRTSTLSKDLTDNKIKIYNEFKTTINKRIYKELLMLAMDDNYALKDIKLGLKETEEVKNYLVEVTNNIRDVKKNRQEPAIPAYLVGIYSIYKIAKIFTRDEFSFLMFNEDKIEHLPNENKIKKKIKNKHILLEKEIIDLSNLKRTLEEKYKNETSHMNQINKYSNEVLNKIEKF